MARKTEIEAVERTWSRDLERKELHLEDIGRITRIRMRLLGQRTRVEHLYRWFQEWLASEQGIAYENGTVRDAIHMDGVPRKYQLAGGWTIRQDDIPFLSHGPLLAEDGRTVLVRPYSLAERFIKAAKLLGAVVGLVYAALKGLPMLLT